MMQQLIDIRLPVQYGIDCLDRSRAGGGFRVNAYGIMKRFLLHNF